MSRACCYSSQYCFTFFCSFTWRVTESVCSTNALPIAMHRQARTLFLFTYAKIAHVSASTYPSKYNTYVTYPQAFIAARPLAELPRRGPVPKLLWADLFFICRPSVCLSVILQYCVKTKERGGMWPSQSGSPVSLAFWMVDGDDPVQVKVECKRGRPPCENSYTYFAS